MTAWLLQWLSTAGVLTAVVAVVGWLVQNRIATRLERLKRDLADSLAARARRADFLRDQIAHLYGPLAFLVESSARSVEMNHKVMNAYNEYFLGQGDEGTRAEARGVIETANSYAGHVVENNKRAMKLLRRSWGWLDPDDIEDTVQYLTDIVRHNVGAKDE